MMFERNLILSPASNPKSSSISQSDEPIVTHLPFINSDTLQIGTIPITSISLSIVYLNSAFSEVTITSSTSSSVSVKKVQFGRITSVIPSVIGWLNKRFIFTFCFLFID